jgi:hypothetical protein
LSGNRQINVFLFAKKLTDYFAMKSIAPLMSLIEQARLRRLAKFFCESGATQHYA